MICPECKTEMKMIRCPCTDALQYVCPECGHAENVEEPPAYNQGKTYNLRKERDWWKPEGA